MSRVLVLPDIHCKHVIAQNIIESTEHDRLICLGDFFDDFGDSSELNKQTAEWLVDSLNKPNRVHLLGNHDQMYFFGGLHRCSGYSAGKDYVINEVMKDNWSKLKLFHYEQSFLFTHAGFTWSLFKSLCSKYHITCRYRENNIENILECLGVAAKEAWENACNGGYPKLLAAGWDRGGREKHGGITWVDLGSFLPIPNISQIAGHTIVKEPNIVYIGKKNPQSIGRCFYTEFQDQENIISKNYFIDSHLRHYMIIENGKVTIHETDKL